MEGQRLVPTFRCQEQASRISVLLKPPHSTPFCFLQEFQSIFIKGKMPPSCQIRSWPSAGRNQKEFMLLLMLFFVLFFFTAKP